MVRPSSPPAHNLAQPVKLSAAQPRRSGVQPPSHRAVRAVSRSPGEAEQAPAPKPALLSVTGSKPGTTAASSAPCSNTCRRSNGRTTTVTPPKPWPHNNGVWPEGGTPLETCSGPARLAQAGSTCVSLVVLVPTHGHIRPHDHKGLFHCFDQPFADRNLSSGRPLSGRS